MERNGVPLITVLGNIGSGKTTITKALFESNLIDKRKVLVGEPVDEWKKIGLLQNFYQDMKRWACVFQMFAFSSRIRRYKDIDWKNYDLCISDAHMISDRHVFAENLHNSGFIDNEEKMYYDIYFEHWKKIAPETIPTLWVYLRTLPSTSKERIERRITIEGRPEESGITLEYLQGLHENFEKLVQLDEVKDNLLIIDAEQSKEEIVRQIMERILLLVQ